LRVSVDVWWWGWDFYPIRWRNPPRECVRVVTLAEQVRETHRQELRMSSADAEREEQEAIERDKLRKKEAEIMDEIRRRKEAEKSKEG
jgi:hypothetical protein